MPIQDHSSDRPMCVPSLKDEPFLPSITSPSDVVDNYNTLAPNPNPNTAGNSIGHNSYDDDDEYNYNANYRFDSYMKDSYNANKGNSYNLQYSQNLCMFKNDFKTYSSAPGSESSTPFKLPTIDRSKSNSVTSLASERYARSRGWSRDRRSRLCRSPSRSSSFWGELHDTQDACKPEQYHGLVGNCAEDDVVASINNSSYDVSPFLSERNDNTNVKFPSIFQSNSSNNAKLNMSSSTANSSAHNSRNASPFSFRRESTFINLSSSLHHDGNIDSMSSTNINGTTTNNSKKKKKKESFYNGDDNVNNVSSVVDAPDTSLPRSGTQNSALLLPIQSGHEMRNPMKAKRKRKKQQTGLLSAGEMGSDAEKLLREKLGAIEKREQNDFDDFNLSHNDGENSTLSESAFIDKVTDENCLANGNGASDSEPLASKPPLYQNTSTVIATENSMAPVKA